MSEARAWNEPVQRTRNSDSGESNFSERLYADFEIGSYNESRRPMVSYTSISQEDLDALILPIMGLSSASEDSYSLTAHELQSIAIAGDSSFAEHDIEDYYIFV